MTVNMIVLHFIYLNVSFPRFRCKAVKKFKKKMKELSTKSGFLLLIILRKFYKTHLFTNELNFKLHF